VNIKFHLTTGFLLPIGAAGGLLAETVGLPMPWMLGSLLFVALAVSLRKSNLPENYEFPANFRKFFMAFIGIMIGSQVNWALINQAPQMLPSLVAISFFVVLAHASNFFIFYKIGHYDKSTAFFCGAPGGLMESISMGEEAGCDIRVLTVQQFLRIILVIILVPIFMSIWIGEPVGSASGIKLPEVTTKLALPSNYALVLLLAVLGLYVGPKLRLPAGHLMGPLLLTAVVNLTGIGPIYLPDFMLVISQIVVGAGLGCRFLGIDKLILYRAVGLSLVSVISMLALGLLLCFVIFPISSIPVNVLLICFAPGGVTEMSLIALSLSANPATVTLHHLYRIILTVLGLTLLRKRLGLIKV
jgi:membrane AbrB-like protein